MFSVWVRYSSHKHPNYPIGIIIHALARGLGSDHVNFWTLRINTRHTR